MPSGSVEVTVEEKWMEEEEELRRKAYVCGQTREMM